VQSLANGDRSDGKVCKTGLTWIDERDSEQIRAMTSDQSSKMLLAVDVFLGRSNVGVPLAYLTTNI
jgi:hypothetical protein